MRANAAEQIAAILRAVGVQDTVLSGSIDQVTDAIADGRYDLALVGVNLSEVPNLRPLLIRRTAPSTFPAPPAPKLDALLARTFTAATEEEMIDAYSDLQMFIVERLPFLGLVFRTAACSPRAPWPA